MARPGTLGVDPLTAPRNEGGKFASEYPTDGRELVLLWEMPETALHSERVKIARYLPGTQQTQLVGDCPIVDFDLGQVTRDFGPGRYLLKPGPGQYSARTCTLNLSEEYARANGWRSVPMLPKQEPTATDAYLADRMTRATREALPAVDVATMIELAVQKALAAQPRAQTPDPTTSVMSGFELAMTMMDKARNFVNPAAAVVEKEPASLGDALMAHGPQLLGILQQGLSMLAAPKAAPAVQPAPARPQPMQTAPQPSAPVPTLPAGPHTRTEEEAMHEVEALHLDQETANAVGPILGVLNEFAPKLIHFLGMPIPASALGAQLAGMIGPDLEESALALAEVVALKGPGILGIRYPEMATPKAAEVVAACAAALRAERGDQ